MPAVTDGKCAAQAATQRVSHSPTSVEQDMGPFAAYQQPHYEASGDGYDLVYPDVYDDHHHKRIGKIVFPDVVELEGSGAGDLYLRYAPHEDSAELNRIPKGTKVRRHKKKTSPARKITHLLFGYPKGPDEPPEDILRYTKKPKHLLIRYSLLNQYLPLTVSTTPSLPDHKEHGPRFMYLEAPPTDCYCDESCVKLGDCCSDYTYVCPPRDCKVTDWYPWEGCVPDKGECGTGVEQRVRYVSQRPERGGASCPPLKEMRVCFKKCAKQRSLDDVTTVALLLDYRYNDTRSKTSRDNIYWDLPSVREKLNQATKIGRNLCSFIRLQRFCPILNGLYKATILSHCSYCVKYKIGWVNRNCRHKQLKKHLYRGNTICAECQPEATIHRETGRCASDLEDGEQGFWKLIGPKSCNGIWTRIERTDNCHCSRDHQNLDAFLLV